MRFKILRIIIQYILFLDSNHFPLNDKNKATFVKILATFTVFPVELISTKIPKKDLSVRQMKDEKNKTWRAFCFDQVMKTNFKNNFGLQNSFFSKNCFKAKT